MEFEVAPLPYSKHALQPVLKQDTPEFHYEKHHKGYMTNLKGLLEGKRWGACDARSIAPESSIPRHARAAGHKAAGAPSSVARRVLLASYDE